MVSLRREKEQQWKHLHIWDSVFMQINARRLSIRPNYLFRNGRF